MATKTIWQSKTFWFNVITILVTLAGELSNAFPSGQIAKIATVVLTVGNIILRIISSATITMSK